MSRLIALIDEYRESRGMPSEASIARQVGVAPQTINSWRNRGLKELPNKETLRKLAEVLHMSDADVFYAAGVDAGFIIETIVEIPEADESTSA